MADKKKKKGTYSLPPGLKKYGGDRKARYQQSDLVRRSAENLGETSDIAESKMDKSPTKGDMGTLTPLSTLKRMANERHPDREGITIERKLRKKFPQKKKAKNK